MANSRESRLWKSSGATITKDIIDKGNPTEENLADFLFAIGKDDITFHLIMQLFGAFEGKYLAHPYDLLEVPVGKFSIYKDQFKNEFSANKNAFTTTVGLFIFNIFLRDFNFSRLFDGYFSETINSDVFGDIESTLSYALLENKITTDEFMKWEDTMQWLMPFETILSPNHTEKMITCTKAINAKKQELIKKYKKEIEEGSPVIAEKMEKELLAFAKEYLGDDPSVDTIESKAIGDFNNNFKNMYVMKGAVQNPDPNAKKRYDIITGNFLDGIPANEYAASAGSGVQGAYARGKKTENGGYYEKLFISAYQTLKLDPPNSDCGTKKYITVTLDKKNIKEYMYCYIIKSNGSLELLDSSNKDKYIGQTVKFRFSSMCESKTGICNKCAGELFYLLGEKYIGISLAQIPDTMKLRCMKGFHNAVVQTNKMNVYKAFFPWEDE